MLYPRFLPFSSHILQTLLEQAKLSLNLRNSSKYTPKKQGSTILHSIQLRVI